MKYRELWLPEGGPNGPSQLPGDRAQQVGRADLKAHTEPALGPSGPANPGWTAQKDYASDRRTHPDLSPAQVQEEF